MAGQLALGTHGTKAAVGALQHGLKLLVKKYPVDVRFGLGRGSAFGDQRKNLDITTDYLLNNIMKDKSADAITDEELRLQLRKVEQRQKRSLSKGSSKPSFSKPICKNNSLPKRTNAIHLSGVCFEYEVIVQHINVF